MPKHNIIRACSRPLWFLSLLTSVSLPVSAYAEASNDELLKQLKQMQSRMEEMQKEMNKMKGELAQSKSQPKVSDKVSQRVAEDIKKDIKSGKLKLTDAKTKSPESDVKITMVPAPKFETADGAYSFKVGGFVQTDAGMFNDDKKDHPDGTQFRRARLNVSGTIAKDWNYKFENDFGLATSVVTDAFIEYTGFAPVTVMVGQFKEPFMLENLTSDLFTSFIERSSAVAFAPDRQIGAQVMTYGDAPVIGAWTAAVGGFGANGSVASTDDESKDATARITFAPFSAATEVLHFGAAGSYRVPDRATNNMTFQSRPETRLTSSQIVSTGAISSLESTRLLGLEAAGVYGPFSLQSEYIAAEVDRKGALATQDFYSYYVEASYFLTGESRAYNAKKGIFDRVKPKWNFNPSEGNWGAWQVAARWSDINLNDSVIKGGDMKDVTLGLRWIPHPNLSFMLNYIKVNSDNKAVVHNDDPDVWMLRAQFDF